MAAFYSQVYNQEDTLYLLPGEDRRYINENPPRMPSQNGKAPRRYSFTGCIAVCGSFLYTATFCPHQRYFRRVGTRTLILIGFAIWSFIPASSATCLSSENAFAVIAMMGMFAFWDRPSAVSFCRIVAVHHRHLDVHKDQLIRSVRRFFQHIHTFHAVFGAVYRAAFFLQQLGSDLRIEVVVLGQQDSCAAQALPCPQGQPRVSPVFPPRTQCGREWSR